MPLATTSLVVAALSALAPPVMLVSDPASLVTLENSGLDIGAVAFDARGAQDNAALAHTSALYRDVVDALTSDIASRYRFDPSYGVGMKHTHRGFDLGWLTSAAARFELVAVVNRIDRKAFDLGTCGEVRLIYRLAYTKSTASGAFSSRVPATINVVFVLPDDGAGCSKTAERFTHPLRDDVLADASLGPVHLKSVEIDVQTARWPSTVRPDLGGHADYALRVFHRVADKDRAHLVEAPLENTPDVDKLVSDHKLHDELLAFLLAHKSDIDAGTVVVPEKFLATRALSVTPHGLARAQNRPWTRVLTAADAAALVVPSSTIASPLAVLRRLDGLTCMGCHQSRSIAGFHVVGADRDANESATLAIAVGISPHLEEDLPRRTAYVDALLHKAPVDDHRRQPEHELDRGAFGDACGLGDAGFSSWTCALGNHCVAVDDADVGECMPNTPSPGSACRLGRVDAKRDRITKSTELACDSTSVCEGVDVGFPGGMCASTCDSLGEHGACGAIAILTPFNDCLAHGGLFTECAKNARPAALRKCGPNDPCRSDYICAGAGVCLPPYFVLQMRVDGHPRQP